MRDRRGLAGLALGAGLSCGFGVALGHHLSGVGLAVGLLAGASLVATSLVAMVLRHRSLVRGLERSSTPTQLAGIGVRTGPLGEAAFVAGLGRPTIYCDTSLPDQLTAAELRAVLLHERAHQRAFDPARLMLLGLAAPVARRLPSGRQWLAVALARREIAADRFALANGARRRDLAGALLRLPPLTRAHVAGFTPAIDLRLQALLGEVAEVPPSRWFRSGMTFLVAAVTGVAMCSWWLHHWLSTMSGSPCC